MQQPHPLENFFGKIILICANLFEVGRNMGKIETKFEQNQNIASEKTFDFLRLWSKYCPVTFPLCSVTFLNYSDTICLGQQPVFWQSAAVAMLSALSVTAAL